MNATVHKFGFWFGIAAFAANAAFVIAQTLQLLRVLIYPLAMLRLAIMFKKNFGKEHISSY